MPSGGRPGSPSPPRRDPASKAQPASPSATLPGGASGAGSPAPRAPAPPHPVRGPEPSPSGGTGGRPFGVPRVSLPGGPAPSGPPQGHRIEGPPRDRGHHGRRDRGPKTFLRPPAPAERRARPDPGARPDPEGRRPHGAARPGLSFVALQSPGARPEGQGTPARGPASASMSAGVLPITGHPCARATLQGRSPAPAWRGEPPGFPPPARGPVAHLSVVARPPPISSTCARTGPPACAEGRHLRRSHPCP